MYQTLNLTLTWQLDETLALLFQGVSWSPQARRSGRPSMGRRRRSTSSCETLVRSPPTSSSCPCLGPCLEMTRTRTSELPPDGLASSLNRQVSWVPKAYPPDRRPTHTPNLCPLKRHASPCHQAFALNSLVLFKLFVNDDDTDFRPGPDRPPH